MPQLDGIDIYHGQADKGPVELDKVAAIPTWWFAAKATQSTTFKDPMFDTFMAQAKLLFSHRLGYHWLSSITDPLQQADWFLGQTNGAEGIGVMVDIEEAGDTVPKALACFERIENHTRRPGVGYSGLYVTGGTIWNSPELRMSQYGPRPFIVAAYVTLTNLQARMKALNSLPYQGWQFSSNGPVDGIVGRCDMDQIDDRAVFDLACGIGTQPVEVDMVQNYYVVAGANARFIGTPALLRWTGPGDARLEASMAKQVDLGNLTLVPLSGVYALADSILDGPLPEGDTLHVWTGDEFANSAEIHARRPTQGPTGPQGEPGPPGATGAPGADASAAVDDVARKGVADLHTSIADVGQSLGDTQAKLRQAGTPG